MPNGYDRFSAGYAVCMKIDALLRRLRFAAPAPKREDAILPQDTDLKEWGAIHRHGPLPITYLYEFTKGERKNYPNLQRRYTRFYHNGFVLRPERQYASFHARYSPLVYDLSAKAKASLDSEACMHPPSRSAPFLHQLMQSCVTASLELLAPSKGLRFVCRDEVLAHERCRQQSLTLQLKNTKLIPDDLFALERADGKRRIFFLEVDRNTESIERVLPTYNTWSKKIAGYDEMFRHGLHTEAWGFPMATVLTVTTNKRHAENLAAYANKNSRYPDRYIFAVEETFGANWRVPKELLTTIEQI
jgi:hypothetical protein